MLNKGIDDLISPACFCVQKNCIKADSVESSVCIVEVSKLKNSSPVNAVPGATA
jgi:hypothetical protein